MIKKPKFWDKKQLNFLSIILLPLTFIIIARNIITKLIKKKKFQKKSICIGNIYLGGTGKTPLTIKLNQILSNLNFNIGMVKKYYPNQKDEQDLLGKNNNLIVVNRRIDSFKIAREQNFDLLLFDDGLQDRNIDYDLKFVCFKASKWIGNGQLIPAGPLRERLSSIHKYDAIFFNSENSLPLSIIENIKSINPSIKIFETMYSIKNLDNFNKNKNYLIFSGIGDPESFKNLLLQNNFKISREIIFPDHHEYSEKDMIKILDESDKLGLGIITTEKDIVKIDKKYSDKINFLKIDLKIKKETDLINFINEKLNQKN